MLGHTWHTCRVHHKTVLGHPNHSIGGAVCTCEGGQSPAADDVVLPIRPDEVKAKAPNPTVVKAANELIQERWNGTSATFKLVELEDRALLLIHGNAAVDPDVRGNTRKDLHAVKTFDIEQVFRDVGWEVKYNSPDMYESFPATFTFTRNA
jgi:hypothetical protein